MNVTDIQCPDCQADIGDYCFDMETKYIFPPYEYRKVIRTGSLLAHSSRRKETTKERTEQ